MPILTPNPNVVIFPDGEALKEDFYEAVGSRFHPLFPGLAAAGCLAVLLGVTVFTNPAQPLTFMALLPGLLAGGAAGMAIGRTSRAFKQQKSFRRIVDTYNYWLHEGFYVLDNGEDAVALDDPELKLIARHTLPGSDLTLHVELVGLFKGQVHLIRAKVFAIDGTVVQARASTLVGAVPASLEQSFPGYGALIRATIDRHRLASAINCKRGV